MMNMWYTSKEHKPCEDGGSGGTEKPGADS